MQFFRARSRDIIDEEWSIDQFLHHIINKIAVISKYILKFLSLLGRIARSIPRTVWDHLSQLRVCTSAGFQGNRPRNCLVKFLLDRLVAGRADSLINPSISFLFLQGQMASKESTWCLFLSGFSWSRWLSSIASEVDRKHLASRCWCPSRCIHRAARLTGSIVQGLGCWVYLWSLRWGGWWFLVFLGAGCRCAFRIFGGWRGQAPRAGWLLQGPGCHRCYSRRPASEPEIPSSLFLMPQSRCRL